MLPETYFIRSRIVYFLLATGLGVLLAAGLYGQTPKKKSAAKQEGEILLTVLGTAQDGGYPQAGCKRPCCRAARDDQRLRRFVASVAVVDRKRGQRWLFDCTPDFPQQLENLNRVSGATESNPGLDGIFLTHAHIGHYSGLIHLGREVMGAKEVPVYAMPRMGEFLKSNGPWSQLVKLKNIEIRSLAADQTVRLNEQLSVTPFLVPHRDEFSETVGFRIESSNKTVLFLPDIDKWSRWDRSIERMLGSVDIAYLDGTFFDGGELPGRDMTQIPHPFVVESIQRFASLDLSHRAKVRFIHLNHTNPALQTDSRATKQIEQSGMRVARQGEVVKL